MTETISHQSERSVDTRNGHTIIQLERIHKVYPMVDFEVHALRGISLVVKRGEFVAIMGPSGSGKSTMMNIIGCLDHPTRGRYFLEDANVSAMPKPALADIRNKKIGFVFQNLNLIPRTSAIENVELPLVYAGVSARECIRRAREALSNVGLTDREQSMPNQLSGGQQQRVAIARALVNNPSIILADEPTGSLDSRTSVEVMEIFQRLKRERNLTIVIVTHEPNVAQYAERIVLFRDGRVQRDTMVENRKNALEILRNLPPEVEEEDYEEDEINGHN
jgi:putative ABC transport system ATP-binding protein